MSSTAVTVTYLSYPEAGRRLGYSSYMVGQMVKEGLLPSIELDVGGRVRPRIPASAVDDMIRQKGRTRVRIDPMDPAAIEAEAERMLNEARAAGRLPAETPPEVTAFVAGIIRSHLSERKGRRVR
jgi:hypothetical protein